MSGARKALAEPASATGLGAPMRRGIGRTDEAAEPRADRESASGSRRAPTCHKSPQGKAGCRMARAFGASPRPEAMEPADEGEDRGDEEEWRGGEVKMEVRRATMASRVEREQEESPRRTLCPPSASCPLTHCSHVSCAQAVGAGRRLEGRASSERREDEKRGNRKVDERRVDERRDDERRDDERRENEGGENEGRGRQSTTEDESTRAREHESTRG